MEIRITQSYSQNMKSSISYALHIQDAYKYALMIIPIVAILAGNRQNS